MATRAYMPPRISPPRMMSTISMTISKDSGYGFQAGLGAMTGRAPSLVTGATP